jgi:signal transduction histidine kinase
MRRQLALLVAATTSVVLLAFLVPLAVLVSRAAASNAISDATSRSQVVVSAVASGADRAEVEAVARQLATAGLRVTVTETDPAAAAGRRATVTRTADGGAVIRQPVVVDGGTVLVQTRIPRSELRAGVSRAWLVLGLLGAVLITLSLVVADRLARTITRPISDLAGIAERLARGDLQARVEPRGPEEVREVGEALNLLAARIRELLAGEREAVADLSHRLRTPVTALRLDVESLPPGEDHDRLVSAVDELTREVDRLIREARRPQEDALESRCDACEVVQERVQFWQALAEDQDRAVTVHLSPAPCPVRVTRADLETALDALLGNVIAHTPEGTGVTVTVERAEVGGGAVVVVCDEGPRFAGPDVVRRGESRTGSTGLGLDIARRTAAASGGELQLGSAPGGGARVLMRLGAPVSREPRG